MCHFLRGKTQWVKMTRKRKRTRSFIQENVADARKRLKPDLDLQVVIHPTLDLYYTQKSTLRNHLLLKLPTSSKTRRRKIFSAKKDLLDRVVVCKVDLQQPNKESFWSKDFEIFSQKLSPTAGSSIGEGSTSQSELVDFAIWLLFHRIHKQVHRPPHMLCQGYQRANNPRRMNEDHGALAGIPGLISHYPNGNVDTLKNIAWAELLGLLGREGDRIMLDLILDGAMFMAVDGGPSNFYQLSGGFDGPLAG